VPQGAVLSPTLFNIFTSDFHTLIDVQLALFADDSELFSTHAKADVIIDRLQSAKECYLPREESVSFLHAIYLWMATLFLGVTVQSTRA
jgi:hypothetical protein